MIYITAYCSGEGTEKREESKVWNKFPMKEGG